MILTIQHFLIFLLSFTYSYGEISFKHLIDGPECQEDIKQYCEGKKLRSNYDVLQCLQASEEIINNLSNECHHSLYNAKKEYTRTQMFGNHTKRMCGTELTKYYQCGNEEVQHKIPCLLTHINEIPHNSTCYHYLVQMGPIIFTDYTLIYKFVDSCQNDINKYSCGRLGTGNEAKEPLSQFKTITCLAEKYDQLEPVCKSQMLRVSELQSSDYHLDRSLYRACEGDREKFCHDVEAGEGRVYSCLFRNKDHSDISTSCANELRRRELDRARDVKTDYEFINSCKVDIERNECAKNLDSKDEFVQLSSILLCLESADKFAETDKTEPLQPECRYELTSIRKEILSDYKITPEVVQHCSSVIETYCGKKYDKNTYMCLMDLAQKNSSILGENANKECYTSLYHVLEMTDAEDISPVVLYTCDDEINNLCKNSKGAEIYKCLGKNLKDKSMGRLCRENIIALSYFVSRDTLLDRDLYVDCHTAAVKYCDAPKKWNKDFTEIDRGSLFHCLYVIFKSDEEASMIAEETNESDVKYKLPEKCHRRIYQTLEIQAQNHKLQPRLHQACLQDIHEKCEYGTDMKDKDTITCLQEKYKTLSKKCQVEVLEVQEKFETWPKLDQAMYVSCKRYAMEHCSKQFDKEGNELMECLLTRLDDTNMPKRCRQTMIHQKLISLENYKIDKRFMISCKRDIDNLCGDLKKKQKADVDVVIPVEDVVACLSTSVTEAMFKNLPNPLSPNCEKKFRYELLVQSMDITLNPAVERECANDIRKFCPKVEPVEVESCLRRNQEELGSRCHLVLFKREKLEAADSRMDGRLQRICRGMIKMHCYEQWNNPGALYACLKQKAMDPDLPHFDDNCRNAVLERMEVQSRDVRLHPALLRDCNSDLKNYCPMYRESGPDGNSIEYEGEVLNCLKKQFTTEGRLSYSCYGYVRELVIEAHLNEHLDPTLLRACKAHIKRNCASEVEKETKLDGIGLGRVTECLKDDMINMKINEKKCEVEVRRIALEGSMDIKADPSVNERCAYDLAKFCSHVPAGFGRQLACLMGLLDQQHDSTQPTPSKEILSTQCAELLIRRKVMWTFAGSRKFAAAQSFKELASHVWFSPIKSYFLVCISVVFLIILALGLLCGRASKRIAIDLKNR